MWKKIALALLGVFGLTLTFGSSGAYESELTQAASDRGSVKISYVNWDSEIGSTNVLAKVLENEGFDVELVSLENSVMWQSLASGESDASVSAWLPISHGAQYEEYKDQLDNLGSNLEGARTGLAVPEYIDGVDSIADLSDEADQTITGIEPGAGVTETTEKALETYNNLTGWHQDTSSSGAMATLLGQAIAKGEPIIVTGWRPHWIFQEYDIKFLDDPEEIFGNENVYTMARKGFKEDNPEAYSVIDAFNWTIDESEEVLNDIHQGTDPEQAAETWLDNHPERVAEWTADLHAMEENA